MPGMPIINKKIIFFPKKLFFWLSLLSVPIFIFSTFSNAQGCTPAQDGMLLTHDTEICSGTFKLHNGLKAAENNILIDCNNASLDGSGVSYGIMISGRIGVGIKNCNITNFEVGIYIENSNESRIDGNYLSKNKFGIALFSSLNSKFSNNIIEGNSAGSLIEYYSPVQEKNKTIVVVKTLVTTPQEIFQSAIKLKKPGITDSEIIAEMDSVFSRLNRTQENLRLERFYAFNESSNITEVTLRLTPRRILLNLSVYERIPKCMSEFIGDISFRENNYEVLEADPLIVWNFPRLESRQEVAYKIKGSVTVECKKLLIVFGIASDFIEEAENKSLFNYQSLGKPAIVIFALIAIAILIKQKSGKENS